MSSPGAKPVWLRRGLTTPPQNGYHHGSDSRSRLEVSPMIPEMQTMLTARSYAVVGASRRRDKYGYRVYRVLKAAGRIVYPVNPGADEVDGDHCYPTISDLPEMPQVVVLVVPPAVTEAIVAECVRLGITQVWIQPGAESEAAVATCRANKIAVISGGPCLMVLLHDFPT